MDDYHRLGVAVFSALKPGGHALINVDAPVREWRPGFGTERGFHPWRMMLDWAEEIGFRVPDRLVFGRQSMPGLATGRFKSGWEPLLWFQKQGGDPFFDSHSIAKRSHSLSWTTKEATSYRKAGREAAQTKHGHPIRGRCAADGIALPSTLWDYGNYGEFTRGAKDIERQNHPARWPYKLAEDIVRCFCPPDGLACDPFVGAGTSAVAALEHGRRFIGGDLGSRQDNDDNRARRLDPVPWVEVTARVLTERFKQERLFG